MGVLLTQFAPATHFGGPQPQVVPRPVASQSLPGTFTLDHQTRVSAQDPESRRIAGFFKDFLLRAYGLTLSPTAAGPKSSNSIVFTTAGSQDLPAEG